jgi:molybdopterin-guanine dinucleotide biosynthesis protein A
MSLGGVVLAGGRSTRMGRPKALLDWRGVPLVVHVARAVAEATGGPVVVVGAADQQLPEGLTVVRDPEPDRGPLMGLATGLAALEAERAFVCATDQPHAHRVLGELLPHAADVVAYAGQPLGALYRTDLAVDLDLGSLRAQLAAVDTLWLPDPPAALLSIDTPEDYSAAMRSA